MKWVKMPIGEFTKVFPFIEAETDDGQLRALVIAVKGMMFRIEKATDYSAALKISKQVDGDEKERTRVTGSKIVAGEDVRIVKYFEDEHQSYSDSFQFARKLEEDGFSGIATRVKVIVGDDGKIIRELGPVNEGATF